MTKEEALAAIDARFAEPTERMESRFQRVVKTDKIAEAVALLDMKVERFHAENQREFKEMRSLNEAAFADIQKRLNVYDQRLGLS